MDNSYENQSSMSALKKLYYGLYKGITPLVFLSLAGALAGYFSQFGWLLDLASHLYIQYLTVQIVGLFIFISLHKHILSALCSAGILLSMFQMYPAYYPPPQPSSGGEDQLRIVQMNVNNANNQTNDTEQYLLSLHPDILILQEVGRRDFRKSIRKQFSYSYPQKGFHESIILSNIPLKDADFLRKNESLFLRTTFKTLPDEPPFALYAIHTASPKTSGYYHNRNQQILGLAKYLQEQEERQIVLGDFNTSPWSSIFKTFKQMTDLKDTRVGFGLQTTWPAFMPFSFLQIPIDHCFVSRGITVRHRSTGRALDSDHRPLVIDLTIPHAQKDQDSAASSNQVSDPPPSSFKRVNK